MRMSNLFPPNTDPFKLRTMRGSTAAAAFLRHSWSDLMNSTGSMLQGASTVPAAHSRTALAHWIVFLMSKQHPVVLSSPARHQR
jgi:hypothetical protein